VKILALETSCDETACAIVEDGRTEISSTVASSAELHQKTGGIVPEVAARKQVESILPVIEDCLNKSGLEISEIDALAVTVGPGLIGSLLVGVEAAKALSLVWEKPLIPVNHLIGHIYGNFLENGHPLEISFPAVVLVVSGGHTDLVLMRDHGDFSYLGGTLDDAAGEAFDKSARLLGLSAYLGGPELSAEAEKCSENTLQGRLPRPMLDQDNYDFSFSGLKTAVRRLKEKVSVPREVLACEFESAAVEVLVTKTIKAATDYRVPTILLGGGVAANKRLRTQLKEKAEEQGIKVFLPPMKYCGDTAVYIASAAYYNYLPESIPEVKANPSLGIVHKV
jgi:N6-L-threonylcarbamoyladenine synthase